MDVEFAGESRGRPLIVTGGHLVSFSDGSTKLFTADPNLLISEIVQACAPHSQKLAKLKQDMMKGFVDDD
jgi:hypothetical protein